MIISRIYLLSLLFFAVIFGGFAACGGGGGGSGGSVEPGFAECSLSSEGGSGESACETGSFCTTTTDNGTACVSEESLIAMQGNVYDINTLAAIEGATVVLLDINGAPLSDVATTAADGTYELTIIPPVDRDVDTGEITLIEDPAGYLNVSAQAYEDFPSGLRESLPIDLSNPEATESGQLISNSLTEVALIPLDVVTGTGSIVGTVELPENVVGALVVAELGDSAFTGIADRDGGYQIFNLPPGTYTVTPYVQGVTYDSATVDLADGATNTLDFSFTEGELATVSGALNFVNTPGEIRETSVLLIVESTFDEVTKRGKLPPGLRVEVGTPDTDSAAYTFEGVPPGNYVVLAAYENDFLVQDPDEGIAGTDILHLTVNAGDNIALDNFKITEALEVFAPGETVNIPDPTFIFADDSGEDGYTVSLLNNDGQEIWTVNVPKVTGSDTVEVIYNSDGSGPVLESGKYYQFRAVSYDISGDLLSATEDLKGVFLVE